MKRLLITCLIAFAITGCRKDNSIQLNKTVEVDVTISGGYETVASDGGRPTLLIASALGISQAKFQEAFSGVTPAKNGSPTTAEELANKAALLRVLAPLGITNEKLDEVSNYYRYLGANGEVWTRVPATAKATVVDGKVTKVTITNAGSGYCSTPLLTVPGASSQLTAIVSFSTQFALNGRISAINIQ